MKKISAREIAMMGMLIALQVIITRFVVIQTEFFRISFSFIPVIFMGLLFGPFLAAIGNGLADLIGFFLKPFGMYFPGYTLTAIVLGIVYGASFYNKEITLKRNILTNVIATLLETGLNTIWLYMTIGDKGVIAGLPTRLISAVVLLIIKVLTVQAITSSKALMRPLKSWHQ